MEPRPSDSRTATPKAIELGHVVVNIATGEAGRVRRISPVFGPFDTDATVVVEIGRLPWGREVEWLRRDVMLASEWERWKERAASPIVELQPEDPSPIALAMKRRPRVDRRLRTAPHGDALDTSVRPDPLAELRMAIKVGRLRHLVDDATTHADEFAGLHFTLHPAQRRFMDSPGGILIPRRKSPGARARRNLFGGTTVSNLSWDPGPRLTPGVLKLAGARMMVGPRGGDVAQAMADQIDFEWESRRWAEPPGDAEASSNGMGC